MNRFNRKSRSSVVAIFLSAVLLLSLSCSVIVVASDGDDELTVSDVTETPTQDVTVEGDTYEISSLATNGQGQTLTVDVTVSEETRFDVFLYNTERESETTEIGTGSQQVEFDTESISPGSYVLALYIDGNYVDVQPVVIEGYDVSISPPSEVEADENSIKIETTVTGTELEDSPDNVEVAVWNDDIAVREDASHVEEDTYQATVSSADFEEGESYNVYAVAQGEDEIEEEDEPELLGVSDGGAFDVVSASDENGDGSVGNGGDSGNDQNNGEERDDNESSPSNGDSDNGPDDGTNDNGNESEEENGTTNGTDTNSSDDNDADDAANGPIHPNSSENSDDENGDDDSTPLATIPVLAITGFLLGLVVRLAKIHQ